MLSFVALSVQYLNVKFIGEMRLMIFWASHQKQKPRAGLASAGYAFELEMKGCSVCLMMNFQSWQNAAIDRSITVHVSGSPGLTYLTHFVSSDSDINRLQFEMDRHDRLIDSWRLFDLWDFNNAKDHRSPVKTREEEWLYKTLQNICLLHLLFVFTLTQGHKDMQLLLNIRLMRLQHI